MATTTRKRTRRPAPWARRTRRRTMRRSQPMRALIVTANKGVSFKRTFFTTAWAFGTAATTDFWRRFTPRLSDMPNHLEFNAVFDEYKMTGIKITLHPRFAATNLPINAASSLVANNQMYITIANASKEYELVPTGTYSSATYNNMLEELGSKTRTYRFDRPISLYFRPQIFEEVGGTTGYGYKHVKAPWLQLGTSLQPQYHGMHAFIHDYNFTNLNTFGFGCDVQYTYYFQCRGQA